MNAKKTESGMVRSIVAVVILLVLLTITTFALVYATVSVEENLFRTGRVKINLNNGEPIIREDEFVFEPGMTVKKDFFIENLSTWDVYYKLYFREVSGNLADELEITIKDGDKPIYNGTMLSLTGERSLPVAEPLAVMEKKTLSIYFHFPEDGGNQLQNQKLQFDLSADAVQTKNNPNRAFS